MTRGLFITFEGIDGCGKTTQLGRAHAYLQEKGYECIVTREPGGTPIGEKIRELLLSSAHGEMSDSVELLLYLAARAQHVDERIRPAVEAGRIVLCDRFQDATFAYQGYGRGYDMDLVAKLNAFATSGLVPTHTFVFDVSVETAFERMKGMGKAPDRLEQSSVEFYTKTRDGYKALALTSADRITLLDGEKPVDELSGAVRRRMDSLLAAAERGEGRIASLPGKEQPLR